MCFFLYVLYGQTMQSSAWYAWLTAKLIKQSEVWSQLAWFPFGVGSFNKFICNAISISLINVIMKSLFLKTWLFSAKRSIYSRQNHVFARKKWICLVNCDSLLISTFHTIFFNEYSLHFNLFITQFSLSALFRMCLVKLCWSPVVEAESEHILHGISAI